MPNTGPPNSRLGFDSSGRPYNPIEEYSNPRQIASRVVGLYDTSGPQLLRQSVAVQHLTMPGLRASTRLRPGNILAWSSGVQSSVDNLKVRLAREDDAPSRQQPDPTSLSSIMGVAIEDTLAGKKLVAITFGPVKVRVKSGEAINVGDWITFSDIPGVGKKLDKAVSTPLDIPLEIEGLAIAQQETSASDAHSHGGVTQAVDQT